MTRCEVSFLLKFSRIVKELSDQRPTSTTKNLAKTRIYITVKFVTKTSIKLESSSIKDIADEGGNIADKGGGQVYLIYIYKIIQNCHFSESLKRRAVKVPLVIPKVNMNPLMNPMTSNSSYR